jgi:hypothetical protein
MGFPSISTDGTAGGQVLTTASGAVTGQFYAIQALASAQLHRDTVGNVSGLVGVALPAGTTVFGRWTSLRLGDGTVLAYNAK